MPSVADPNWFNSDSQHSAISDLDPTYMYRLRKMPTRIFYLYLLNKFIFNVLTTIFFPIQKQSDPEPRQNIWIQTDQDPQHYAVQIAI